ncbi:efflux RND transporter periplasmic adaptor subunit [Opitutaceae bacterium LMO-CP1]|nr:efflux RND transporter periplasmic adaptor subunit [Opitutaceae bacterium LMO-M01]
MQAVARATVSAQTMGTVDRAPIAIGQTVTAGQTLVTLSATELNARVAQARAALDQATRDHQREADLLTRGASTAETVRALEDQRRMVAAALDAVSAQLAHTTVVAPFDGVITQRLVESGDFAAPGTPLFTIEGSDLEVEVAVPESLRSLTVGDPVTVEADFVPYAGTVREASPAANAATRSRLVRILINAAAPLRAGQFVRVRWPDTTVPTLTIPASAVTTFGQMQRVFVVADGHAVLRLVKTGHTTEGVTTVLAGLNAGETVVINPPAPLRDGQSLQISR